MKNTNPAQLLRMFTVFSLISLVVILLLVTVGIRNIYTRHNIEDAENDAVNIGEALFEQERQVLLTTDAAGSRTLGVSEEYFAGLDTRMRRFLKPLEITKIKVFSRDMKIVYSTDHAIIGRLDQGNEKLNRALRGEVVSKLERKGEVWDLAGEQRYDLDVVETYLPVRAQGGEIVGSFEIYLDITRYRAELKRILRSSIAVIALILLAVFSCLFAFMYKGTRQLGVAQEELRRLAVTDGLTGIFNRRHVLSRAEEEFARLQRLQSGVDRSASAIGCIMVDIDHFKKINDTYGHLIGDEILKELARRMSNSIRKYDIVGRYGGEEFLIVLPNADFDQTRTVAERIWRNVREAPFRHQESTYNVTISVGVACLQATNGDINSTLKRADEGLYKAKNSGRDQVAWIADDGEQHG